MNAVLNERRSHIRWCFRCQWHEGGVDIKAAIKTHLYQEDAELIVVSHLKVEGRLVISNFWSANKINFRSISDELGEDFCIASLMM